jgi:2-succinyl-5-enolpyruvyl-6-hydroxy-3-cyclohexene-1-carboxylate synthase
VSVCLCLFVCLCVCERECLGSVAGAWPVRCALRCGVCGSELVTKTMRVDVVVQLGTHLVSKRLATAIASAVSRDGAQHLIVTDAPGRHDPAATATHMLHMAPAAFARAVSRSVGRGRWRRSGLLGLADMSAAVQAALRRTLLRRTQLDEAYVAFRVTSEVPAGGALFLSSSMPVRGVEALQFAV